MHLKTQSTGLNDPAMKMSPGVTELHLWSDISVRLPNICLEATWRTAKKSGVQKQDKNTKSEG